jgi:ribonuclease HII
LSITLCGIDEAGRGPLAGYLVVAGVILTTPVLGLNDSKKLSVAKRDKLCEQIILHNHYHFVVTSPQDIDSKGLSACLKASLESIIDNLNADKYLFDGSCTFGAKNIETMVKADASVPEVMAASIVAKTIRDRLTLEDAKEYAQYNFASHKGYGTAKHIEEIKMHGLTPMHRKSFCTKILCHNERFEQTD